MEADDDDGEDPVAPLADNACAAISANNAWLNSGVSGNCRSLLIAAAAAAAAAAADAFAAAALLLLLLLFDEEPCPEEEDEDVPGILPVANACIAAKSDGNAPWDNVSRIFLLSRSNFSNACLLACCAAELSLARLSAALEPLLLELCEMSKPADLVSESSKCLSCGSKSC